MQLFREALLLQLFSVSGDKKEKSFVSVFLVIVKANKPGPAQVGAISKAQK